MAIGFYRRRWRFFLEVGGIWSGWLVFVRSCGFLILVLIFMNGRIWLVSGSTWFVFCWFVWWIIIV